MVVSTSTDQPQTLSFHQKFSAKTNNETQSSKSYKNNLQTLRNPLKQKHPKKTHTRQNRNKTTLAKNNQQGVCIHRCFDSPLKSATPGLHPTLFPGPLLFSVLSSSPFSLPETDPPSLPPALRSKLHTQNKKKFQTLSTDRRRRCSFKE
jgi:hypothetical protein